jgi:hypothetical protein
MHKQILMLRSSPFILEFINCYLKMILTNRIKYFCLIRTLLFKQLVYFKFVQYQIKKYKNKTFLMYKINLIFIH